MSDTLTREAWLERAIDILRPRFVEVGFPLPERIHVSVGFGYGARRENGVILGQTWATIASDDEVNHLFISPEIGDTALVLGVLMHELVHVALDCEDGHKGRFAECATRIGLTGKMTEALPSMALSFELFTMADAIGHYPHGRLNAGMVREPRRVPVGPDGTRHRVHTGPARQTSRMLKACCPECGYTVRLARRWLDVATPLCPNPACGCSGLPMDHD